MTDPRLEAAVEAFEQHYVAGHFGDQPVCICGDDAPVGEVAADWMKRHRMAAARAALLAAQVSDTEGGQ